MNKYVVGVTLSLLAIFSHAGEKVDRILDADANGYVDIEHVNGYASVQGWNKPQVRVVGELGDKTEHFTFERSGNRVSIEVDVKRSSHWGWGSGDDGDTLQIFVPENSRLSYESSNANVEVSKVYGGAHIETVNGKIEARDLKGKLILEAVNGDIRAKDLVSSKLKIETVNGNIRDQNSQAVGSQYETVNGNIEADSDSQDLLAETVNGDIELSLKKVNELNLSTVNGHIEAHMDLLADGNVRASTVGGSVDLHFPKEVSARFDIQGHAGGRIHNHLSEHQPQKAKYGPSRWLSFSLNDGQGAVEVSTVSGRVKLHRK